MAGVTGHKALTKGLFDLMMLAELSVKVDTQQAADEAAKAGEDMVRRVIDTFPSSLRPGKRGRNWTYHMRHSVKSEVKRNGNTTTIRAGWLSTKEGYFLIQNDGGQLGETTIEPMEALMKGHEAMIGTLKGWGIKIQ